MKSKVNPTMEMIRQETPPEVNKQVDLCVAIANRVYDLLEERGMSQRDLARALGKTETEVSRWLSGTHNLTVATIAKMATVLGDDIIAATSTHGYETCPCPDGGTETTLVAEDAAEYEKS